MPRQAIDVTFNTCKDSLLAPILLCILIGFNFMLYLYTLSIYVNEKYGNIGRMFEKMVFNNTESYHT